MKGKIKGIFISFMSFLMIFSNFTPISVRAETYTTSAKNHSTWWLADPSTGRRDEHEAELFINGEQVFCIDAFTSFKSGVTMNAVDWSTVGISQEMAKELSLIAYFGSKVDGRKGKDWYAITQGLIWKTLHESQGHTDMCYVETPTNPDYATTVKLWNEIKADVAAYKKTPSFTDGDYEVDAGKSITLTDTNNSLKNMVVKDDGGLNVSISGSNELIISGTTDSPDKATITLQRNIDPAQVGASVAFYNGKTQSVAKFKISDPLQIKLSVKVNKFGSLELTKYNDDGSATVKDTTFRITGPNGFDETHTTDSNGQIKLDNLVLGDYKAVETKSADGYLINVNEKGFTIKANQTTTIDFSNKEPSAQIILSKVDKETGETPQGDATLKGATYQLKAAEDIYNKAKTKKFYSKGDIVATRVTDEKGKMESIDNLPLGHYQAVETHASNGYLIDSNIYDIYCSYEGQTVEKILRSQISKEQVMKQAFDIIKISSDGESGEVDTLEGAEFTVKLNSDIQKNGWDKAKAYDVLKTDKKGYAKSIELPYGTYTVKETKIPDNVYPVNDFTVVIDHDSREPQSWKVLNDAPFKALIKAVKLDKETGKTILLPDTTFKIKNLDTGEYVGQWVWFPIPHYMTEFKTDKSGTVTTPSTLGIGEYQIEEIHAPEGYILDKEPIKFTVSANTPYQIADDGKTPIISVTKEDISVKGSISVAKIGEQVTNIFKDSNGNIQFIYEKLPVNGTKFIVKADEDIYSADNQKTLIYAKGDKVAELTTDYGYAETDLLPLGKYNIYEKTAGDGFVINKEIKKVSLTYKDEHTSVVFDDVEYENNRQKVEIEVEKQDKDTGTPLSGAVFGLYAKENIYGIDNRPMRSKRLLVEKGTLIETAVSDSNGVAHFDSDLPIGNLFEIKEMKAPIGYASTTQLETVDTSYQGQDKETLKFSYVFMNDITKVEISKKDITNKDEIEGAHLTVYPKDSKGEIFDTWISGQDGKNEDGTIKPHIIKGLEVGKTYVLKETSSPYGYAIADEVEFTVSDTGEIQSVEMKDEMVFGELKWNKTGEIFDQVIIGQTEFGTTYSPIWNKSNLLAAEVTIYAAEDIKIGNTTYFHEGDKVEVLESEWESVTSKKLPVGKYYYQETKTPHGYLLDANKHYFEIKDSQITDLQIIESTLENKRPTFDIDMTKVLEEQNIFKSDDAYKDVVFGIYAREDIYDYMGNVAIENGSLISTTGIDKDGHLVTVPDLPNGVYYLTELQTNAQYVLNEREYDFEVAYHGEDVSKYTIMIGNDGIIDNELARGTISVKKVDFDTKGALSDVQFNISVHEDMSYIIKSVKTDKEGIALFDELELGTYFVQESKQVDGYVLNDHIYKVEVTKDGDLLEVVCENKPTEMEFSKIDITTGEELPGAKISVTDKETGKTIDEWVSTDTPHKIKYLVEGKEYVMTEIIAPKGYDIAESITFIAKDGQKIVMKDTVTPRNDNPKTGDVSHVGSWITLAGLSGAVLMIALRKKRKDYE